MKDKDLRTMLIAWDQMKYRVHRAVFTVLSHTDYVAVQDLNAWWQRQIHNGTMEVPPSLFLLSAQPFSFLDAASSTSNMDAITDVTTSSDTTYVQPMTDNSSSPTDEFDIALAFPNGYVCNHFI